MPESVTYVPGMRCNPSTRKGTVWTDLHRVAASGTSCTHPARWSKSASVLATAAFRPRATGHARRKRTLRWREADVRRGTGSGGLARGSLRRHRPPRLRLESLDRLDLPLVALDGPVSSRW